MFLKWKRKVETMATVSGGDDVGELGVSAAEVDDLLAVTPDDVAPPEQLTFARNVFIPLTTDCRYTCTYCTYFDPPARPQLTPDEVRGILDRGVTAGCTEALFTFGGRSRRPIYGHLQATRGTRPQRYSLVSPGDV